jgi:glycine/D-amino acid oxidase-like deaminating enzyme
VTVGPRVVVFGAGAFGGWTALTLVRRGARVTLFDAWGPGNSRASSGGETRVIRATYGTHRVYTRMAARALDLWRANEARWQRTFFRRTGVLWMFGPPNDGRFGRASSEALLADGLPIEALPIEEAARRYPQIDFDGIANVLFEPEAGYLLARRACEHVVERVVAEGGEYRLGAVAMPLRLDDTRVSSVALGDGARIEADQFVFACGPWLGRIFPDVLARFITVTRQDVYYFGPPAGDSRFGEDRLPVWVDFRDRLLYGIPGNIHRGFKIADDAPGDEFDPTDGQRNVSDSGIARARAFLAQRFPALAHAPVVGAEVCQYESTPDANFVIDRHPAASNVWIAGGGSGHGFKMGPVVGEMLSALVLDAAEPDPMFAWHRFSNPPTGGWQPKWS